MEVRSYSKDVKIANIQFMQIFNDIKIYRYNKRGNILRDQPIKVPVLYGNTSAIIKEFKNSKHILSLPIISVNRGNTNRDIDRVCDTTNIASMLFAPDTTSKNYDPRYLRPNPVNIEYELQIWANYEEDLHQIESNFVGWFNPSIFISRLHPFDKSKVLRSQILWDGSISHELSGDLDGTRRDVYKATTSFTFKTFIFIGDSDLTPLDWNANQIKSIYLGDESIKDKNTASTHLWLTNEGTIIDNDDNIIFDNDGNPQAQIFNNKIKDGNGNVIAKLVDGHWEDSKGNEFIDVDGNIIKDSVAFNKIINDGFYCVESDENTLDVFDQIQTTKTHSELRYHEDIDNLEHESD